MKKLELSTELTLRRFFEKHEAFAIQLRNANGKALTNMLDVLAEQSGLHPNFVRINAEDIKRLTY